MRIEHSGLSFLAMVVIFRPLSKTSETSATTCAIVYDGGGGFGSWFSVVASHRKTTVFDGGSGDASCGYDFWVFVGSRLNVTGAWQMPQGGIEDGEEPKSAAIRELQEETGVVSAEIIAKVSNWLAYDFPVPTSREDQIS
ncbi:hypothetical protein ACLB2K_034491 [Fragaria x ananassa]